MRGEGAHRLRQVEGLLGVVIRHVLADGAETVVIDSEAPEHAQSTDGGAVVVMPTGGVDELEHVRQFDVIESLLGETASRAC